MDFEIVTFLGAMYPFARGAADISIRAITTPHPIHFDEFPEWN